MAARSGFASIDDYIAAFPPEVQSILERIRSMVRRASPQAVEKSVTGPTFDLDGGLIDFAAFKNHIGVFPPVHGDEKLRKKLARYRGEKGNLRFPLDEPMPDSLLARVIQCRVKEHRERVRSKRKK